MFFTSSYSNRLSLILNTSWKQARCLRTSIQTCKEKFQITLGVGNFVKDEMRVKARSDYIVIEGKQERKTKDGYVMRQFVRKFRLPMGCDPRTMKSSLSPEGVLTITAPRKFCEVDLPCEQLVPIDYTGPGKQVEPLTIVDIKPADKCK